MNLAHAVALSLLLAGTGDKVDAFEDKGELFIKAGKNKGLKIGSEVKLLGDKIGDTDERRVLGKATVMEVWDSLARVAPDDASKKVKPAAAQLEVAEAPRAQGCTDADPNAQPVSQHWGMWNDHFVGKCCGVNVEVLAKGTTLGAKLELQIDGKSVDQQEPYSGNTVTLKGTAKNGKPVAVEVVVGTLAGDYRLKVGGQTCELVHQ